MRLRRLLFAILAGCAHSGPPPSMGPEFHKMATRAVEPCEPDPRTCFDDGRALLDVEGRAQDSFDLITSACAAGFGDACELGGVNYRAPRRVGPKNSGCHQAGLNEVRCRIRVDGSPEECFIEKQWPTDPEPDQAVVDAVRSSRFEPATWKGVPVESLYLELLCN